MNVDVRDSINFLSHLCMGKDFFSLGLVHFQSNFSLGRGQIQKQKISLGLIQSRVVWCNKERTWKGCSKKSKKRERGGGGGRRPERKKKADK